MSRDLSPLDSLHITNVLLERMIKQGEFSGLDLNFHVQKGLEALYTLNTSEVRRFHELDKFVKLYFKYKSAEAIWNGKAITVADAPTIVKEIMYVANDVDKRKEEFENSFGVPVGKVTLFMETYFRFMKQIHYEQNTVDEAIMDVIYEMDALDKKLIHEDDWAEINNPSDLLGYACVNNYDSFVDSIVKTSEIFSGDPDVFDSSMYVIKKARMADWGHGMIIADSSFSLPAGKVQRFVEQYVPFNHKTNKHVDENGRIIER